MRAVSKLTTCAIILSLGLTAVEALAAPRQPSPPVANAKRRQPPPPTVVAVHRQLSPKVVAAKLQPLPLNKAKLLKERLYETTTGTKDPRTGRDLSKNSHLGIGLPGGKDLSKEFPSGEKQWNDRIKGSLGGGSDYLGTGTPFDDKPGSNPVDDFLGQHGGNLADPLAAQGKNRSGFSPAEGSVDQGSSSIYCASDYIAAEDLGKAGDVCVVIEYDGQGDFKTETDRKMAVDFINEWVPKESSGQQYEGEGGYTGGGGHSANDLNIGSRGRITGKVVGGPDTGEAGLGKDTGGRTPAVFDAIEKYVAQGGKIRGGKAGYQGGDSGLGQDVGGAAGKTISGLKKASDAQRFVIDPNAPNPDQIPWWLEKRVSPMDQASTAQGNATQAGLQQGVAAQQKNVANTK